MIINEIGARKLLDSSWLIYFILGMHDTWQYFKDKVDAVSHKEPCC